MQHDSGIDRRSIICATLMTMASAACGQNTGAGSKRLVGTARNVRDFGARGDGITDDAAAFQRAIDAVAAAGGGTVIFDPGTYLVRYRPADDGDGVTALTLRSGVTLQGTDRKNCVLKLADAQMGPGTYARLISSTGEIARASLRRFTINGNRQGQGRFSDDFSGAAILLGWKGKCTGVTIDEMIVDSAIGQGIMLQGSIGNPSRDLHIVNNLVERSSFIGIQCSQFDGVTIAKNEVNDCHDNGIDVYGDDTIGHSTISTSRNATIADNRIYRCSIGVFLETVADCIAIRNEIIDCTGAGVRINRIHGEPRNLTVERNRIIGTPTGVAMGGETGGVVIRDNVIRGFGTAGIEFGYNVSEVTATGNRFVPASPATAIVLGTPTVLGSTPEERLFNIRIQQNHIPAGHADTRIFVNGYRRVSNVTIGDFIKDAR